MGYVADGGRSLAGRVATGHESLALIGSRVRGTTAGNEARLLDVCAGQLQGQSTCVASCEAQDSYKAWLQGTRSVRGMAMGHEDCGRACCRVWTTCGTLQQGASHIWELAAKRKPYS